MIEWRLAFRNLVRNQRRTLISVLMIAAGFCAMVLFQGFSSFVLGGLEASVIQTQFGHLQIETDLSWSRKPVDRIADRYMTNVDDIQQVVEKTLQPKSVSGRLSFYGLLSTGDQSVAARGIGFDPSIEVTMRDSLIIKAGKSISDRSDYAIMLGDGLAESLEIKVGDRATLMAQTLDGSMNAIDTDVAAIVQTGVKEVDNITFYLPLQLAQKLMDTESLERIVIMLDETEGYESKRELLAAALNKELPSGLGVRSWFELATLYRSSKSFFDVQNRVIEVIILVMVLLSILNTVSNSVMERLGEIGTLRAIGFQPREMIAQFVREGILLAFFSNIIGILGALIITYLTSKSGIKIPIPNASVPLDLGFKVLPAAYTQAFVLTLLATMAASYWPALRGTKISIVEALRRA
jgi:putative ABC transport system permease protein